MWEVKKLKILTDCIWNRTTMFDTFYLYFLIFIFCFIALSVNRFHDHYYSFFGFTSEEGKCTDFLPHMIIPRKEALPAIAVAQSVESWTLNLIVIDSIPDNFLTENVRKTSTCITMTLRVQVLGSFRFVQLRICLGASW